MGCVLVVDDRSDDRSRLASVIGLMGHRVLEAADARRALELTRVHGPDLVITDLVMPDMNGYKFVRDLRTDHSVGDTPVIFCTANYVEDEVRELAASCNVSGFLPKPCEPQTIMSVVRDALGSIADNLALPRPAPEDFDSRKLRLLNDKLMQKVCELEAANVELARTSVDLQRSNDDLQEFAYVASHDLSEPLRAVSGMVQLLADGYEGRLGDDADAYITRAVEASKRMQNLIDDLLEYSRVLHGELSRDPTDCSALLTGVVETLAEAIEETGAEVSIDPLPTVRADGGQLQRVFQNVISNALKFCTAPVPRIHVGAVRDGTAWRFSVTDNGIGIEPRHRKQVFEVFKRLHTRDAYPGSGIGLSICSRIVERHGGAIWAQPDRPAGCRVVVLLPGAP